MKYLMILFISIPAFAEDSTEWLCTSASVQKQDGIYYACGVYAANLETKARLYAMKDALAEFNLICEASTNCMNKPRNVEPGRMSCKLINNGLHWKCFQLLKITVGE